MPIRPKACRAKKRDQAIKDAIADWEKDHYPALSPALMIWTNAYKPLVEAGDGKTIERLNEFGSRLSNLSQPEVALEAAAGALNGKLMHYLLRESPDKETYLRTLKSSIPLSNVPYEPGGFGSFEHLSSPYISHIRTGGNMQAFREVVTALPKAHRDCLLVPPDKFHTYGENLIPACVDLYPRDSIGPQADKTVKQSDERVYGACGEVRGKRETVQFILDRYPRPEQRQTLIASGIHAALDHDHFDCIETFVKAIPEERRKEITQDFPLYIASAADGNDKRLFDLLLAAMPPEAKRGIAQNIEIKDAERMMRAHNMDVSQIRQAFADMKPAVLEAHFCEALIRNKGLLAKLAGAFPEPYAPLSKHATTPSRTMSIPSKN